MEREANLLQKLFCFHQALLAHSAIEEEMPFREPASAFAHSAEQVVLGLLGRQVRQWNTPYQ
jgi:hypothetical protein